MISFHKSIPIIFCLTGVDISFIGSVRGNLNYFDETRVPVHVTIEIDKTYIKNEHELSRINHQFFSEFRIYSCNSLPLYFK